MILAISVGEKGEGNLSDKLNDTYIQWINGIECA